jgi:hypothetical protein
MKSKLSNFDCRLQISVRYLVGIFCRFGAFVSSFSVDGIVNGYGLHSPRVRFPAGARDLFSKTSLRAPVPTDASSQWVSVTLSAGVKQPGS